MAWYTVRLFSFHQHNYYPGSRGFLLFFLSKFCDLNRPCPLSEKSLWSRPFGSSLSCHQQLTVVTDWRIFLIALWVIWLDGLNIFGDVIGQKKMPSLRAVKCWASMKVRFSTILTRGFLFSRLVPSISVLHCKFACKKDNIQRKLLGPGNLIIIRYKNLSFTDIHCTAKRKIKAKNEFLHNSAEPKKLYQKLYWTIQ